MHALRTRLSINAIPKDVFTVLTDYEHYSLWNPWLRIVAGTAQAGKQLLVKPRLWTVFLPITYQFDKVVEPSILQRTQVSGIHFIFYTERERLLYTKADGTTLYTTSLRFRGLLGPLGQLLIGRAVGRGIKAETEALKRYCEEHYSAGRLTSRQKRHDSYRSAARKPVKPDDSQKFTPLTV